MRVEGSSQDCVKTFSYVQLIFRETLPALQSYFIARHRGVPRLSFVACLGRSWRFPRCALPAQGLEGLHEQRPHLGLLLLVQRRVGFHKQLKLEDPSEWVCADRFAAGLAP